MVTIEVIIPSTDKGKTAVIRCGMPTAACGGFSSGVNPENRRAFLAEYEGGRKSG